VTEDKGICWSLEPHQTLKRLNKYVRILEIEMKEGSTFALVHFEGIPRFSFTRSLSGAKCFHSSNI
jgi:hypothetical protein